MTLAAVFLWLLAVYLISGLAIALPFVFHGVNKIDPHAVRGSWGFRLMIIPGTMALWPLLLRRWYGHFHAPPTERNAHRRAAQIQPAEPESRAQ